MSFDVAFGIAVRAWERDGSMWAVGGVGRGGVTSVLDLRAGSAAAAGAALWFCATDG